MDEVRLAQQADGVVPAALRFELQRHRFSGQKTRGRDFVDGQVKKLKTKDSLSISCKKNPAMFILLQILQHHFPFQLLSDKSVNPNTHTFFFLKGR